MNNIQRKFIKCSLLMIIFYQSVFAQRDTLVITGTIPSALNGRTLIIRHSPNPFSNFNSVISPQESLIEDGKFSFLILTNSLEVFEILLKDSSKENATRFMLAPRNTLINFGDTVLKNNVVFGNEINTVYKNLRLITHPAKYSKYETRDTLRSLILTNPNAQINTYLISYFYDINNTKLEDEEFLRLWKLIPDSVTNNSMGNTIRFRANHLMVGKKFPEFSLPNTSGVDVKSSDFIGKYLLVEFWASWCLPCRKETPELLEIYEKYKKYNFQVLNISLDTKHNLWIEAIKEDRTAMWTNLSDLIQVPNSTITHKMFSLTSIPHNYLINHDGVIIAKNLWGKELAQFLKKLKLKDNF